MPIRTLRAISLSSATLLLKKYRSYLNVDTLAGTVSYADNLVDDATINAGIESVKDILAKHYVHRNEAELVKSNIKEKGRYKVISGFSPLIPKAPM